MRGLEKPRPPANVSPDGQAPRRFVDAEQEYLAELGSRANKTRFARSEFNRLDKAKLREVMHGEQGSICVYCERRLSEGVPPPQVEHWRPVNGAPEFAIHWNNLYLSCPTRDTCDSRKRDRRLKAKDTDPELPWPTEFPYERAVGFTTAGRVYVRTDVSLDEPTRNALELAIDDREHGGQKRSAILNLNHPTLREARRMALDNEQTRLERSFSEHAPSAEDRATRATQILARDPLPEHVSIRVAWLLDTVGQGL